MKIFLSWSGDRSHAVAQIWKVWLKQMIQATDPWISSADIAKGSQPLPTIANQLENTDFGIICLVPENLDSRWLHFEAGALSKKADSNVCTFLLGLTPTDIEPPLGQFQHTKFEKEDIFQLVQNINQKFDGNALEESFLAQQFEIFWPSLEEKLNEVANSTQTPVVRRSDREILEEILGMIRSQERRVQITDDDNYVERRLLEEIHRLKSVSERQHTNNLKLKIVNARLKQQLNIPADIPDEVIMSQNQDTNLSILNLKVGDRVSHPTYGEGMVQHVLNRYSPTASARIAFPNIEKHLILSDASLTKLPPRITPPPSDEVVNIPNDDMDTDPFAED